MLPSQTKLFGQGGRPGMCSAAGPQTPSTPDWLIAVLQPSQAPVQARLQQTPSTQKPLAHWEGLVQAVPIPWLPGCAPVQVPLTHVWPAAQVVVQVPQWLASVCRFTQAPLHWVGVPLGQQTLPGTVLPAPAGAQTSPATHWFLAVQA